MQVLVISFVSMPQFLLNSLRIYGNLKLDKRDSGLKETVYSGQGPGLKEGMVAAGGILSTMVQYILPRHSFCWSGLPGKLNIASLLIFFWKHSILTAVIPTFPHGDS